MPLTVLLLAATLPLGAPTDQPPADTVENLFPLAVGHTWTYKVFGQDDRFVVRVVRQEMVGDQTCYRLEARMRDRVVATEDVAFTPNGLARFRVDREDVTPPAPFLKRPGSSAVTWTVKYRLGDGRGSADFSAMPGPEMRVPAGRFKTVYTRADLGPENGSRVMNAWYAPGVGLIKQTVSDGKRPPYLVLELERFELAQ